MSVLNHKMMIVMRTDLNMRKGKMVAQGAHAAMMCLITRSTGMSEPEINEWESRIKTWLEESQMAKVCVGVNSLEVLMGIKQQAQELGIAAHVVTDAGFTEFHGVPTVTCMALGPDRADKLDKVTAHLKLL